jgi:hypothetical protein
MAVPSSLRNNIQPKLSRKEAGVQLPYAEIIFDMIRSILKKDQVAVTSRHFKARHIDAERLKKRIDIMFRFARAQTTARLILIPSQKLSIADIVRRDAR